MKNESQLIFEFAKDFDRPLLKSQGISEHQEAEEFQERDIRRAVMAWLAKFIPYSVGVMVPTRISKYRASIAASWSKAVSKKGRKTLYPYKTAIIEIRTVKNSCAAECGKKDGLNSILAAEKARKAQLEANIRKNEPELKLTDTLFSDIEAWDYSKSGNKNYFKCCRKIKELERNINNGSRFERIRQALLADYLYLAVPRGLVKKENIADGWGLLYVNEDMPVDIVVEPENWNCPVEHKMHLIQNIAKASTNVLYNANGILLSKSGKTKFIRIPKKRRNYC
jgi:hypothetical protein